VEIVRCLGHKAAMKLDPAGADRREALFGGQGAVLVWDLMRGQALEPFSAVLGCELEPGASVGPHVQQRDPEIVICLEGRGTAKVNGQAHALEPGAVVALPHGSTLALANEEPAAPLRYLIIKAQLAAKHG
jgi:quercetin dioxygenase-like cupin family protein